MTRVADLHEKWMMEPDYAKAYADLETEFALAREMIEARTRAGLTQDELASRMDTSRTVIARLFAAATGSRLAISFVPAPKEQTRKQRATKSAASA